jgi:hypothetical protein
MAAEWKGSAEALPGCRMPHGQMAEGEGGEMIERILQSWCRRFHKRISTAVNGKYTCWRCLRTYEAGYR